VAEKFVMELLRLASVLLYGSLALVAFFLVLVALFPRRIGRTQAIAEGMPGRSFVVGLVNLIFGAAVVLALVALAQWTHIQLLGAPALAILALVVLAVAFGLGGLVQLIGTRLLPEQPGPRRTIAATLALGWACTLPFVGWFGLLPVAAAIGTGAFILTFFSQPGQPQ
jgi:hypothetical protein